MVSKKIRKFRAIKLRAKIGRIVDWGYIGIALLPTLFTGLLYWIGHRASEHLGAWPQPNDPDPYVMLATETFVQYLNWLDWLLMPLLWSFPLWVLLFPIWRYFNRKALFLPRLLLFIVSWGLLILEPLNLFSWYLH